MDRVRDWMTADPETIPADASLGECARRMARSAIRHLPVLNAAGALVGLVTDAAVSQRGRLLGADARWAPWDAADADRTALDVAVAADVVVSPGEAIAAALDRLVRTSQDAFVVVDGAERPVGIFTEHDGVRMAQQRLPFDLLVERAWAGQLWGVAPGAPATDAWRLMQEKRIRHVLILDQGLLAGVISWRDLVREDVPRGRALTAREVGAGREVRVITEGTPLRQAAESMLQHRVGCLPLVEFPERPVGILTRTDLIHAVIRTFP